MITTKRGTSFRLAVQFETEEEWGMLFPADYAMSQIKFGEQYFDLELVVDQLSRCIYVKGDTEDWPIAEGAFDIKVITGDLIQSLPELTGIEVTVVEGITR